MSKPMTIRQIAAKIDEYLRRFEKNPETNPRNEKYGTRPYYNAGAFASGRWVRVVYITYQSSDALDREQALRYLSWLDKGNVGRHFEAFREKEEV